MRDRGDEVALRDRLIVDEHVALSLGLVGLAGEQYPPRHIAHVDQRHVVLAGADHHHLVPLDPAREAGKACRVTGSVDPTRANDGDGRALLSDHLRQQSFAGDLRATVWVRLLAQWSALITYAAQVVAVDGNRADVDDAFDTSRHCDSDQ